MLRKALIAPLNRGLETVIRAVLVSSVVRRCFADSLLKQFQPNAKWTSANALAELFQATDAWCGHRSLSTSVRTLLVYNYIS